MIEPTVGRQVWYYPKGIAEGVQPQAATVAYVHDDRRINIHTFNPIGQGVNFVGEVRLLQDDDEPPPAYDKGFCCWMPYQTGQAQRTSHDAQRAAHAEKELDALKDSLRSSPSAMDRELAAADGKPLTEEPVGNVADSDQSNR